MALPAEELQIFSYFRIVGASYDDETQKIWSEILAKYPQDADEPQKRLQDSLTLINSMIKEFDLEIVETRDELSGKKMHCLIATNNFGMSQKSHFYNKQTCELLSKIIQECVLSRCGYMSEINCLNLSTSIKSSKSSIQGLLQSLIKDKWLVSEDGKISLGMRCLLEMEVTIKNMYPDHVKHCSLCKQFMMQGFTCSKCECHAHLHCVGKYHRLNKSGTPRSCPMCRRETEGVEGVASNTGLTSGDDPPPAKKRKSGK